MNQIQLDADRADPETRQIDALRSALSGMRAAIEVLDAQGADLPALHLDHAIELLKEHMRLMTGGRPT